MGLIKSSFKFILFAYLAKTLYIYFANLGVGVHFNNVHPGKCRIVPNITCGSEQILVTSDGLAFITNGYKGLTQCNPEYTEGNLYTFDFNNPEENPQKLKVVSTTLDSLSFDPHGMDIIEDHIQGIVNVYVVNHAVDGDTIEVFMYNKKTPTEIVHTRTIKDDSFVCLNDITVIDDKSFYVTNFLKYCRVAKIMLTVELVLGLQTSNIVYYQNGVSKVVATGNFFNGITLSKDRTKVVSVKTSSKDLHIFDRESNGDLSLKKKLFLGHSPDNVFVDKQTGHFYVAYFKDPFSINMVAANTSTYSGSGAAMVSIDSDAMENLDVKEIFFDSGENFVIASSSFVHYKGHYLIGSVFDKLGYCKKD